jgi:hypothetical protein
MSKIVSAVFENRVAATHAVDGLLSAGFGQADISVLMSDETQGREFGVEVHSKAPEGVAAGATAGGILGALAATLVALGLVVIPGVGLVAAGHLVAALAGAGAGGAVGGLLGGLVGLGIPEHEAKMMAERIAKGGILVGVLAHPDRVKQADEILRSVGGLHLRHS